MDFPLWRTTCNSTKPLSLSLTGWHAWTAWIISASDHHPVNRVANSGYYGFDELFETVVGQSGIVVNPKPATDNIDEIIAVGKAPGSEAYKPNTIVTGWMNSPGHRKAILTPKYREMGIGISSIRQGEVYWCVVFANK